MKPFIYFETLGNFKYWMGKRSVGEDMEEKEKCEGQKETKTT